MDFVTIGHITKDILEVNGKRTFATGGSATYCSLIAKELGAKIGIVSKIGKDFDISYLKGIDTTGISSSDVTTTFMNRYTKGRRYQELYAAAPPILPGEIPKKYIRSKFIHLGSVINEIPLETIKFVRENTDALISADVQGFVRKRSGTRVDRVRYNLKSLIGLVDIFKVSIADEFGYVFPSIGSARKFFSKHNCIGLLTNGERGSVVLFGDESHYIPAFKTKTIDPTGAGDVYTATFDLKFAETGQIRNSALFASAAASFVVEGWGTSTIPDEKQIIDRIMGKR